MDELQNGLGSDGPVMERLLGMLGSLRAVVRDFSDLLRSSSERQERDLEETRKEFREGVGSVKDRLARIEFELGRIHEDTDPRGHRKYDPAEEDTDKQGGALVAAARLAEKVPTAWWATVAKAAFAVMSGAGIHWLVQFLKEKP